MVNDIGFHNEGISTVLKDALDDDIQQVVTPAIHAMTERGVSLESIETCSLSASSRERFFTGAKIPCLTKSFQEVCFNLIIIDK